MGVWNYVRIKSLRAKTHYMPWQYFISCYYNRKKLCQKKTFLKNFELDYTFLLEVWIECNRVMYWPWHWQGQEIRNKQEFRKNCCNSYSHVQENNRQGKGVIRQKCQKKQNSVLRRSIKIMAVRHLIIYDHKLQPAVAWNKIKKLESEIEEWRTMYKNIENYNSTAENSVAKVFSSRCPLCWIRA